VSSIAGQRPAVPVQLCFLDVGEPTLTAALDAYAERSVVVVPLLLSTGYHVQSDIPNTVAGRPSVLVARHLGPDPLLVDVLVDRLVEASDRHTATGVDTLLVGAGSSRPDAAAELAAMAAKLADRLGTHVAVGTLAGDPADDLAAAIAAAQRPVQVSTYLLAEGSFLDQLQTLARGRADVAAPLGVHPALVELVWRRYDEAAAR
jgi:sirohydrochlorin ferrochelatase